MELPELNSVVPAELYTRASAKDEWRPVVSSVFYRLRQSALNAVVDLISVPVP